MIVPHTQVSTIIDIYEPGTHVNIEVDMIARYLERLMQYTSS
jgi:riboflavin synthase